MNAGSLDTKHMALSFAQRSLLSSFVAIERHKPDTVAPRECLLRKYQTTLTVEQFVPANECRSHHTDASTIDGVMDSNLLLVRVTGISVLERLSPSL